MMTNEFAVFEALDLAPIKMKLMHVASGEGWSAQRADMVETEYRRFLFLMKKYPDGDTSPTVDVDTFWHYHILDTMKYAVDCEAVFGYFLHHYPYVGMGASASEDDQVAAGKRMRMIYEAEFGDQPAGYAASGMSGSQQVDVGTWSQLAGRPREAANAANAFCSSPGKPGEAVKAATAYCSSSPSMRGLVNNSAIRFVLCPDLLGGSASPTPWLT